jgi:serine/threonine-protein kinase
MSCSSADPDDGQKAKITCRGGVATRDRPGSSQQLQAWSDGECVIKTGPVGDAQVALSQAAGKDRYSLLLSAENAEDDLRGIPVCS